MIVTEFPSHFVGEFDCGFPSQRTDASDSIAKNIVRGTKYVSFALSHRYQYATYVS